MNIHAVQGEAVGTNVIRCISVFLGSISVRYVALMEDIAMEPKLLPIARDWTRTSIDLLNGGTWTILRDRARRVKSVSIDSDRLEKP